jgi:hypothetical protein
VLLVSTAVSQLEVASAAAKGSHHYSGLSYAPAAVVRGEGEHEQGTGELVPGPYPGSRQGGGGPRAKPSSRTGSSSATGEGALPASGAYLYLT